MQKFDLRVMEQVILDILALTDDQDNLQLFLAYKADIQTKFLN